MEEHRDTNQVPERQADSQGVVALGRLELLYDGVWGTVCNNTFDENEARYNIKPAHALHGEVSYFAFVCQCVCVSVTKISKKILNRSTSFSVEAFLLTQGGNHSILKKIAPG